MNKNNIIPNLNPNDLQRFWSKVIKTGSCWEWTSSKSNGYGQFWLNGKLHMVHRITYTLYKDVIPNNLTIDHLCRNRSCVNPDHLEAVTIRENTMRGNTLASKHLSKTHCPKGHEYNHKTKRGFRKCKICMKNNYIKWQDKQKLSEAEK